MRLMHMFPALCKTYRDELETNGCTVEEEQPSDGTFKFYMPGTPDYYFRRGYMTALVFDPDNLPYPGATHIFFLRALLQAAIYRGCRDNLVLPLLISETYIESLDTDSRQNLLRYLIDMVNNTTRSMYAHCWDLQAIAFLLHYSYVVSSMLDYTSYYDVQERLNDTIYVSGKDRLFLRGYVESYKLDSSCPALIDSIRALLN